MYLNVFVHGISIPLQLEREREEGEIGVCELHARKRDRRVRNLQT